MRTFIRAKNDDNDDNDDDDDDDDDRRSEKPHKHAYEYKKLSVMLFRPGIFHYFLNEAII